MNYVGKKEWIEMPDSEKLTFLEQGEFQVHEMGKDGPSVFIAMVEHNKRFLSVSTPEKSLTEAQEYGDSQVKGLIKILKQDLQTAIVKLEDK